jgi:hypothetical protein
MDSLTKLLLRRYAPNDPRLAEFSEALAAVAKSTASPSNAPGIKVSPEALEKATGMVVIMNSSVYSESAIFAAMTSFNREHLEYMAYSFTLPTATNGIPAGSWVLTNIEDLDGKN